MKFKAISAAIIAASILTACGSDSDDKKETQDKDPQSQGTTVEFKTSDLVNIQKVLENNADIAYAAYSDSVETAKALKTALAELKATPSDETLAKARKAWVVSREPYGQTEVYRFRKSPIDSSNYENEDGPEGDINAWPLGEALIDYVVTGGDFEKEQVGVTGNKAGIKGAGGTTELTAVDAAENNANNIIGNTAIEITADLLANTATADDEHDVIAGYHAIEFLLWGQDLNNTKAVTDGENRDKAVKTYGAKNDETSLIATGGQRPVSDFIQTPTETAEVVKKVAAVEAVAAPTSSPLANRRHQYLEVAVNKLIEDLEVVRDGWKKGVEGIYRAKFTSVADVDDAKERITEIMTGMGTLSQGELAGERMKIAYINNSQEDEHSCFSDNTHRDIWLNAQGVSNSYYGEYTGYDHDLDPSTPNQRFNNADKVSGYGLDDLMSSIDNDKIKDLKTKLEAALTKTETNYKEIDASARAGKPFDVLIMDKEREDPNNPVAKTILSLNAQAILINDVAETLKLESVLDDEASGCDTASAEASEGEEC